MPPGGLGNRLWWIISAVSIKVKVMGIVVALTFLLGLGITLQVRLVTTRTFQAELDGKAISKGKELAARAVDLVLTNDLFGLHELIKDVVENDEDVLYAFVLDPRGEVLAHSFGGKFPVDLLRVNRLSPGEPYRLQILDTEEGLVHDVAVPIFEGRAGVVRVGLSERRIRARIFSLTRTLLLMAGAVSMVGLSAGYFLTWVLTRPILRLVQATKAVARGDFSQRVPPWAKDEVGELSASFNQMVEALAGAYRELEQKEEVRRQLLEKLIAAQEEERKRLSLELHDEMGQALSSTLLGLTALENHPCAEGFRDRIRELKGIVIQALESIHNLSVELRPRALDDLGLVTALEHFLSDCSRRHGLRIDFQTVGIDNDRFPSYIETALYRIIQEAISNVVRHAEASAVSVLLEKRAGSVVAVVEDDGKGFDPEEVFNLGDERSHLGLWGMKERASMVGGTLIVESAPGEGTTIFVEIPVPEVPDEGENTHPGG